MKKTALVIIWTKSFWKGDGEALGRTEGDHCGQPHPWCTGSRIQQNCIWSSVKDIEDEFRRVIGDRIEIRYSLCIPGDQWSSGEISGNRQTVRETMGNRTRCTGSEESSSEPFAVINVDVDYYGKEAYVKVHDYLQQDHPQDGPMHTRNGAWLGNTYWSLQRKLPQQCAPYRKTAKLITETRLPFKTAYGAETRNDDGTAETLIPGALFPWTCGDWTPEFSITRKALEFLGGIKEGDIKRYIFFRNWSTSWSDRVRQRRCTWDKRWVVRRDEYIREDKVSVQAAFKKLMMRVAIRSDHH